MTVQGILTEEPDHVSQTMVRWAEGLARESIVLVDGIVQRPPPDQQEVHSTSIHEYEIKIRKVRVIVYTMRYAMLSDGFAATCYLRSQHHPAVPGGGRIEAEGVLREGK